MADELLAKTPPPAYYAGGGVFAKGALKLDPCQLSAIITAVANHLYVSLSREEFELVNVLISELSKSMFSMTLLRGICHKEEHHGKEEKKEALPPERGK